MSRNDLNELMNSIGLDQFKAEVKAKNESRGRKPTDLVNHWHSTLTSVPDYRALQPWVDDVLTGAARLSTGNSRVSPQMIFNILQNIPFITTREIKDYINSSRKRQLFGDLIEDDSYCRWLRSVLLSAIRSLDYHTSRGKKVLRDYSDDELSEIKRMEWDLYQEIKQQNELSRKEATLCQD